MRAAKGLLFVLGAACLLVPVRNPDLYWHLNAGGRLVHERVLPRADWLSYTMEGAPWVNFEWGSQGLLRLVHDAAGWPGVWAGKTLVLAAGAAAALGPGAPAVSALWLGTALAPSADARPDNFSFLLFSLLLALLEAARRRRIQTPRAALAAAVLFAAWANLHLGFVFGLVLCAAYAAGETGRFRDYGAVAAAAAAGALVNPHGMSLLDVLAAHARDRRLLAATIYEWRPLSLAVPFDRPAFVLILCAGAWVVYDAVRSRKRPGGAALAALVFGAAALLQRRHAFFAAPPALLAIAPAFVRFPRAAGAAAALLVLHFFLVLAPELPWKGLRVPMPVEGAAEFLEGEKGRLGTRLYNEVADGGYLGWRLAPDYKVFADGRYLFGPLVAEARARAAEPAAFEVWLAGRGVELAVLKPSRVDMIGGKPVPAYERWFPPSRWRAVYRDETAVVLKKVPVLNP